MLNTRKFIPFALAAGLMSGTAAAQEAPTVAQDDPFGCWEVTAGEGSDSGVQTMCAGRAGQILIAGSAFANKHWSRAFNEYFDLLSNADPENEDMIRRAATSALMNGRLDEAVWAANHAGVAGVGSYEIALIDAVRAVRQNDVGGVVKALASVAYVQGDRTALFMNDLRETFDAERNKMLGGKGRDKVSAGELFWPALRKAQESVARKVESYVGIHGPESIADVIDFNQQAVLLRRSAELLMSPEHYEARRDMARVYTQMDYKQAAIAALNAIPLADRTAEDDKLRNALRGGIKPAVLAPQ